MHLEFGLVYATRSGSCAVHTQAKTMFECLCMTHAVVHTISMIRPTPRRTKRASAPRHAYISENACVDHVVAGRHSADISFIEHLSQFNTHCHTQNYLSPFALLLRLSPPSSRHGQL